jgi:cytoskeleton protein RodZ
MMSLEAILNRETGSSMGTFGENLRREREMRGVSLEEISDATKISVRMLHALEADQFDKLPGGIFTRSFLRAYAKYLGLDEETVMAEFQLVAPASAQQADLGRISQQRPPKPAAKSRAAIVALLVALLMLSGGYALYHYGDWPQRMLSHRAREVPRAVVPAPAAAPARQADAGTPAEPSTGAAATTEGVSDAEKGLVLQVAATEPSWVAVEIDGKPAAQRTMEPNEIQTFRAKASFDLITGNAEGIILTLNGKTLDPLGHRGETKKVHLTIKDVQDAAP